MTRIVLALILLGSVANAQAPAGGDEPKIKIMTPPGKSKPAAPRKIIAHKIAPDTMRVVTPRKTKELEKTPKSMFLIKKIRVSPEVGEPQFNPAQAQLRTVINDSALQNIKKYE